ncbi:glycosyltransferase family 4 protein [Pontibacter rugosus]|uniref:Glycosyltransferase family 4 protein n=1 Tax=Pontibacter rugosus TaxID=1745966 RepID=A0ABW3SVG5_9BACT
MTIGISGPVDLKLVACDLGKEELPETNGFPLVSHLINALLKRGYKVIAYTNSGSIDKPVVIHSHNFTVCIACTKPQPGRRFFQYEIKNLASLMQKHPADVIYAFWTYEYAWAALKSNIPTVVSIHDIAHKIFFTQCDMFRFVRLMMNNIVTSKAKHLAANSSYTFNQISKSHKKKAVIINNFFTPDLEDSIVKPAQKHNYIISVVNGFNTRKGIPLALHAFAKVHEKFPEIEYHLIGIDMEPDGLAHAYAIEHNLAKGVKFLGPLLHDHLVQLVANAKILVHPSREESFGMAVMESMVVGTAVIGGENSGFIPYLLDHGKAGVLCDIYSEDALAAAIIKLLSNDTLAAEFASYAYQYVQENFSEEVVIRKHIEVYESLASHYYPLREKKAPALEEGTY